jgi:hypothetical protein
MVLGSPLIAMGSMLCKTFINYEIIKRRIALYFRRLIKLSDLCGIKTEDIIKVTSRSEKNRDVLFMNISFVNIKYKVISQPFSHGFCSTSWKIS